MNCDILPSTNINGEYWFTKNDRWLWIVEAHEPRRLIQIPAEYGIHAIKGCQGYVAVSCQNGLLVLDVTRR